MPKRWKVLWFFSILICVAVAVSQLLWRFDNHIDPPGKAIENAQSYSVHYDLGLRLDIATMQVALAETVMYTNTSSDTLNELVFQIKANAYNDYEEAVFSEYDMPTGYPMGWAEGGIRFSNIRVDGQDAVFSLNPDDDQALRIALPTPLVPNSTAQVEMRGVIAIPPAYGPFGYSVSTLQLSEFYPIVCDYINREWMMEPYSLMSDLPRGALSRITGFFEAPKEVIVTLPASPSDDVNDYTTRYAIDLFAGEFAFAASRDYHVFSETIGDNTIYVYALSRISGEKALEYAAGAFQALEDAFGPYPYSNFVVAEAESLLDLRIYPGALHVSSAYFTRVAQEDLRYRIALGLAQQWTGEMVDIDYNEELWLSALPAIEAVLHHYYLDTLGEKAYNTALNNYISATEWGLDIPIASALYDFPSRNALETTLYSNGYALMNQMREMMGDDAYDAALRGYLETFAYKKADGEDFIQAISGGDEGLANYLREESGYIGQNG